MRGCDRFREALSARIDGEDPGIPDDRIDAHLDVCADCRAWAAAAGALRSHVASTSQPSLEADVLAGLLDEAAPRPGRRSVSEWRVALAVIGLAQLVLAWPGVLDDSHAAAHAANELASWDLGLGVGFLLLAWLPNRAWGALPVVSVMVAFLVGTSLADLIAGRAELAHELVHPFQLVGLACSSVLARRIPRAPIVLRLRSMA